MNYLNELKKILSSDEIDKAYPTYKNSVKNEIIKNLKFKHRE